jgi:hypothetical protein
LYYQLHANENMKYLILFTCLLKFRLAGGSSQPKIFEESSEEEEDEETPEEKGQPKDAFIFLDSKMLAIIVLVNLQQIRF